MLTVRIHSANTTPMENKTTQDLEKALSAKHIPSDHPEIAHFREEINSVHFPASIPIFAGANLVVKAGTTRILGSDGRPVIVNYGTVTVEPGGQILVKSDAHFTAQAFIVQASNIPSLVITGEPGTTGTAKPALPPPTDFGNESNGIAGAPGTTGASGTPGGNSSIFVLNTHVLQGELSITVTGGTGGDGAAGQAGQQGGNARTTSSGGNGGIGGNGGNGGKGGKGGDGGTATIIYGNLGAGARITTKTPAAPGGRGGNGGAGGIGGQPAIAPANLTASKGTTGASGQLGNDGSAGKPGMITVHQQN